MKANEVMLSTTSKNYSKRDEWNFWGLKDHQHIPHLVKWFNQSSFQTLTKLYLFSNSNRRKIPFLLCMYLTYWARKNQKHLECTALLSNTCKIIHTLATLGTVLMQNAVTHEFAYTLFYALMWQIADFARLKVASRRLCNEWLLDAAASFYW